MPPGLHGKGLYPLSKHTSCFVFSFLLIILSSMSQSSRLLLRKVFSCRIVSFCGVARACTCHPVGAQQPAASILFMSALLSLCHYLLNVQDVLADGWQTPRSAVPGGIGVPVGHGRHPIAPSPVWHLLITGVTYPAHQIFTSPFVPVAKLQL